MKILATIVSNVKCSFKTWLALLGVATISSLLHMDSPPGNNRNTRESLLSQKNFGLNHYLARNASNFFSPNSVKELREIVKNGNRFGIKQRVIGSGHSWSTIAVTPHGGQQISLHNLNKIKSINKELKQVTVEAGISLISLADALEEHGLSLPSAAHLHNTLGGTMATGAHGSGIKYSIMAGYVVSLKLINARGYIIHASKSENPSVFNAALVSFGYLGIIVEVTLQCADLFYLEGSSKKVETPIVLNSFTNYLNNEFYRVTLIPFTNYSIHLRTQRVEPVAQNDTYFSGVRRIGLSDLFYYLSSTYLIMMGKLTASFPSLLNIVNPFTASCMDNQVMRTRRSDLLLGAGAGYYEPPHDSLEWAFSLANCSNAVQEVMNIITEHKINALWTDIRFSQKDGIWMSPAYDRDTCWYEVSLYENKRQLVDWFSRKFSEVAIKYGGRPHWGKLFKISANQLKSQYAKWTDFLKIKNLTDPNNRFGNEFTDYYFGL